MEALFRDCGLHGLDANYYHPDILFLEEYSREKAIVFDQGETTLVKLIYRAPSGKGFLLGCSPLSDLGLECDVEARPETLLGFFAWGRSKQGQFCQRMLERPDLGKDYVLFAEVAFGKKSPKLSCALLRGVSWRENFSYDSLCLEVSFDSEKRSVEEAADKISKTFNGRKSRGERVKPGEIPF